MKMVCAACRHENPADSAFCEECGARLERHCPSCGAVAAPSAKFCRACGASLSAGARPAQSAEETRKVVTIVFADLIGSTALHERLDPESVSRLMDRYHRSVRVPVEAHGGTVVQLLGDGVMCAFGVPRVAEDDAIRAVRAAVGVQRAFREFAHEESAVAGNLGVRVAVNTGEVVVSDEHPAGIGDPLNVAARLQQEARDGDVLIGESTQRLVGELVTLERVGVFALKGRSETVTAYRVVSLERPTGASAMPFVGREEELRRIMAVHDAAVASRRARLAVLLGSPGLGKSRLMDEVARRLGGGATVLTAHCDAAGGATFAPVARAVRAHLGIDDATGGDAARTAIDTAVPGDDTERTRIVDGIAALLAGAPASPEETFFVIRRFLTGLAAARPVVLAIDDLQWAEPLLLDLIEHLVQWATDVPLLLIAAARPELREARSSLATPGALVAEVVMLAGLDAGAATRLAANVIGADELPAAVAGRVLATSEGNPLFVGELVRMLVHDGALRREGDRWTTGVEVARLARHGGGAFEGEFLRLTEIDAEGRLLASIHFDPDDRRAAFEEAYARFLAGEAAPIGGQAPIVALQRAFGRRDWETLARCLADDAVIYDRRRVGILGTLSRGQWVESLRTLAELAPDVNGDVFRILTWNRQGRVDVVRLYGTRDGGPFETVLVRIIVIDRDHVQRYEIFDIDAVDEALARFAELCAERTGIDRDTPGN